MQNIQIEKPRLLDRVEESIEKSVKKERSPLNESKNNELYYRDLPPDSINFDVPMAKLYYLILWVKDHIQSEPGNIIKTSELFTRYKEDIEHFHGDLSVIAETRFYKEIGAIMSIFSLQYAKIKTLGGRVYVGINYYNIEKARMETSNNINY